MTGRELCLCGHPAVVHADQRGVCQALVTVIFRTYVRDEPCYCGRFDEVEDVS